MYQHKIPENEIEQAVEDCWSYGDGEAKIANRYNLDYNEIKELMLDYNYEKCHACQNWCPSYEFLDDNCEVLENCEDCRKYS